MTVIRNYNVPMRLLIGKDIGIAEHEHISQDWINDCFRWRGKILVGAYAHWCQDWDFLPIDETTFEWPCPCYMSEGIEETGR